MSYVESPVSQFQGTCIIVERVHPSFSVLEFPLIEHDFPHLKPFTKLQLSHFLTFVKAMLVKYYYMYFEM